MDKNTLNEIGALWEKINSLARSASNFTDIRHSESTEGIANLEAMAEEALCDVDTAYDGRVAELEEALCEISELLS